MTENEPDRSDSQAIRGTGYAWNDLTGSAGNTIVKREGSSSSLPARNALPLRRHLVARAPGRASGRTPSANPTSVRPTYRRAVDALGAIVASLGTRNSLTCFGHWEERTER